MIRTRASLKPAAIPARGMQSVSAPMKNPIPTLRLAALAEAISFLLLLGVAMPLKHIWHLPVAVRIAGSLHGVLFILFCIALARAWKSANWPVSRAALLFVASIVPFAPFFLDKSIHIWADEFDENQTPI